MLQINVLLPVFSIFKWKLTCLNDIRFQENFVNSRYIAVQRVNEPCRRVHCELFS